MQYGTPGMTSICTSVKFIINLSHYLSIYGAQWCLSAPPIRPECAPMMHTRSDLIVLKEKEKCQMSSKINQYGSLTVQKMLHWTGPLKIL